MKKKREKRSCLNCVYGQSIDNHCPKIIYGSGQGDICTEYVRMKYEFPQISIGEHGEYYYRDIDGSVSYA